MKEGCRAITSLFDQAGGGDYLGEPVTQQAHALQAAYAALTAGCGSEEVIAALLHDVGHLAFPEAAGMGGYGTKDHDKLGGHYLAALGLGARVSHLVGLHVAAKRYLVATNLDYAQALSQASLQTLKYQGGAMTPAECQSFERDKDFDCALALRSYDEQAKNPGAVVPGLDYYYPMIEQLLLQQRLTSLQVTEFQQKGYLVLPSLVNADWVALWQKEIEALLRDQGPQPWMTYFESQVTGQRQPCRVEYFVDHAPRLGEMLTGPWLRDIVGQCFGEPAILFKEKVNLKLPGAGGFAPHQDAPAFEGFGQTGHITVMISLDPTTQDNGCLEVASYPGHDITLAMNHDLTLSQAVVERLTWQPIETVPGEVIVFDSWLPHRSSLNKTLRPRRAVYATYSKSAEGDFRERYFSEKREAFPPDAERQPEKHYDPGRFNVGNPIL